MISWTFTGLALGAVLTATFIGDMRRAILALWVAGLSIGGLYLTLGVEMLAVVQWVVSTLVAMSFLFFSSMFGEHTGPKPNTSRMVFMGLSVVVCAGFAAVIRIGSGNLSEEALAVPTAGNDLLALGRELTENHLLSLEVLAFTLFLALIGCGIIARPEPGAGGENP